MSVGFSQNFISVLQDEVSELKLLHLRVKQLLEDLGVEGEYTLLNSHYKQSKDFALKKSFCTTFLRVQYTGIH